MRVHRVVLKNFRNYEFLDQKISNQVNFFLGKNGSGKTNFIEAIYSCLTGHSFRTSKVDALIRKNADAPTLIQLELEINRVFHKVTFSIFGNRKQIKIDDKTSSAIRNTSEFPCVLFSPESLSVIKSGPQERRDLIDQVCLSLNPKKRKLYQDFSRALKSRNRLLKNIINFPDQKEEHLKVLESLNPSFLELGSQLAYNRINTMRNMNSEFEFSSQKIFKNQQLRASLNYQISGESAIDWDLNQVYDAMALRYLQLRSNEQAVGQSLVGPHKHDIIVMYDGQDAREFCSQGQQRSLVLALKIAHVALLRSIRELPPLLLLDDVFSELDQERRQSLFEILGDVNAQIFLTNVNDFQDTHFKNLLQSVFLVEDGKIQEVASQL